MAWTRDKAEHGRRLAICAECPHAVLTIVGKCSQCHVPGVVTAQRDDDARCKRRSCSGTMQGKEIARCGACGCPLASRVYASCPKGNW
ncbi:hypothetical protein SAMN05216571_101268 [Onishia taeanensis]|uniref:Uncharacterized protein n=1 Tax=Onishia taeanensis TaxID=284577 RepID=A0A1G7N7I0_9GAMM|nr:hypothetical protein [Halomonas taeanensis]SDF69902.1 hypothetical protein SAMN05216571_101268 [Halomonas taeanensis]